MKLDQKNIFVSGANRGIGKALVEALLKQPVQKIYTAARTLSDLPNFGDVRVIPVQLDLTNTAQIQAAVALANDTDVLINNAGVLSFAGVLTDNDAQLKNDMLVNYFGTLQVIRAFTPILAQRNGAALANVISIVGLASMVSIGAYSASKAALHSATQAMRAELRSKNISVHGIYPGPIDTDMAKEFNMPKTSAAVTAENIINGIIGGVEDIFPDPMSAQLGAVWAQNPKGLENQFAAM
jgi:NAD(P)-dependent dehydrogenase (short-subunit alcohol dehydrogenase family)